MDNNLAREKVLLLVPCFSICPPLKLDRCFYDIRLLVATIDLFLTYGAIGRKVGCRILVLRELPIDSFLSNGTTNAMNSRSCFHCIIERNRSDNFVSVDGEAFRAEVLGIRIFCRFVAAIDCQSTFKSKFLFVVVGFLPAGHLYLGFWNWLRGYNTCRSNGSCCVFGLFASLVYGVQDTLRNHRGSVFIGADQDFLWNFEQFRNKRMKQGSIVLFPKLYQKIINVVELSFSRKQSSQLVDG
mmetsp:Transcript_15256/g.38433  ORF Transcript_15256/g.38433 Transcript_15256/m.38433 type:complete len:241 (+) Transcript_15256:616-1338(+)